MSAPEPKERDPRPPHAGYASGWYLCRCCYCQAEFWGDKRCVVCADCAYKTPPKEEKRP